MDWKIPFSTESAIYRQIGWTIEKQIIEGGLQPGDRLPPERQWADQLGVNRSTLRLALDELRAEGLIQSIQGQGTHVSESAWELAPRDIPNWYTYTADAGFLPTRDLERRIITARRIPEMLDVSRIEFGADFMFPPITFDPALITSSLRVYPDPQGQPSLREAIAAHLATYYHVRADPEQILVTSGGQQAFHLITQGLLKPGDRIAMEQPSYGYSLPLFISAGLRLFPLPIDRDGIVPEAARALFHRHKIRMVFVNPTYQNPTGTTLSLTRRQQLLEICAALSIPAIEDDPFSLLRLDHVNSVPPALISVNQQPGLVIYLGGLSKVAAPGLRLGWIVGPLPVIERLADTQYQMDHGISQVVQNLAEQYLRAPAWPQYLDRLQRRLAHRWQTMHQAMQQELGPEVTYLVPSGGCGVWCHHSLPVKDAALLEATLAEGIIVAPGTLFGSSHGHFRITFSAIEERSMVDVVRRLKRGLDHLQNA